MHGNLRGLSARRWRAARSGDAGGPTASGVWKREAGRPPGPAAPRATLEDERKIPGRFQPLRASLVGPCLPSAASNRVVSPAFGGRRPWSTSSRLQTPLRGPEHGQGYRNFIRLSSAVLRTCRPAPHPTSLRSAAFSPCRGEGQNPSCKRPLILRSIAPGRCVSKDEGLQGARPLQPPGALVLRDAMLRMAPQDEGVGGAETLRRAAAGRLAPERGEGWGEGRRREGDDGWLGRRIRVDKAPVATALSLP